MRVHLRRIMCTTDFSECSRFTVPYGVALAREFGAMLYVCHVVDLPAVAVYGESIGNGGLDRQDMLAQAEENIGDLMRGYSIEWAPLVADGRTAHEIEALAALKEVDLVISATHGRSGLKRLVLGSVTERLMRRLNCPLMVVRSAEQEAHEVTVETVKFNRILVGLDFSPDSDLAFEHGLSLSQQFQSELHLVHVIEPSVYKDLLKLKTDPDATKQEDLRVEIRKKMKSMIPEEAMNWCSPKISLLAGQPHEELVKYALVNDMDLVVLGFRGHGLMETVFLGSTTARAVRGAVCPVLSVRPTDQAEGHVTPGIPPGG
jgi:nucleotide-binding universal stress UspA family protein